MQNRIYHISVQVIDIWTNEKPMLTKYKTTMFFDELVSLAPLQANLDCAATAIYTVQVASSIAQALVQSEQICMSHRMLLKQVLR